MSAVLERFRPLFHPRGIIITGVSTHPGKFGTVAFHNLLSCGYSGDLFPINREGVESFDRRTFKSVSEVPAGRADTTSNTGSTATSMRSARRPMASSTVVDTRGRAISPRIFRLEPTATESCGKRRPSMSDRERARS